MECPVCAEKHNKSARRQPVSCPYCNYTACRACTETYVLGRPTVPECMNCHKPWTRQQTVRIMTQAFVNTHLKRHRETLLFDQERALMPATQPFVEGRLRMQQIQKEMDVFETEARRVRYLKNALDYELEAVRWREQNTDRDEADNYSAGRALHYRILASAIPAENVARVEELAAAMRPPPNNTPHNPEDPEDPHDSHDVRVQKMAAAMKPKYKYIRACPTAECKGFLNEEWLCGICNMYTCSRCLVGNLACKPSHKAATATAAATAATATATAATAAPPHTCKPEDVETAKLLSKDTKPCPKCAANIFKISGCDQMWCTQCHTAFSWNTGQLQTVVHNPHYYEWMQRTGGHRHDAAPPPPGDRDHCIEDNRLSSYYLTRIMYGTKRVPDEATNYLPPLNAGAGYVESSRSHTGYCNFLQRAMSQAYVRSDFKTEVEYLEHLLLDQGPRPGTKARTIWMPNHDGNKLTPVTRWVPEDQEELKALETIVKEVKGQNDTERCISMIALIEKCKVFIVRMSNYFRIAAHIHGVEMPRLTVVVDPLTNRELRIKYMMNELDEARFRTVIQRDQKRHEKMREFRDVLEMFYITITDVFARLHHQLKDEEYGLMRFMRVSDHALQCMAEALNEMDRIKEYANECMHEIGVTYGCMAYRIDETGYNLQTFRPCKSLIVAANPTTTDDATTTTTTTTTTTDPANDANDATPTPTPQPKRKLPSCIKNVKVRTK